MPIYGEASNHSAVDILCPDLVIHPRSKYSQDYCQKVVLKAGDALFLPEGWFHQVDSDDLTIAVNFWWLSHLVSNMLAHMNSYYLRRIMNRMAGKEMEDILGSSNCELSEKERLSTSDASQGDNMAVITENKCKESTVDIPVADNVDVLSSQALHQLVSLVHHIVSSDQSPTMKHVSSKESKIELREDLEHKPTSKSVILKDDPVASFLWELKPLVFQKTLLAMALNFPRTLEALVLHVLSPVAAEVLTRKFDEMDHVTSKDEQNDFYQRFYSIFDDQFAAMDAILAAKERFAFQAFKGVLDQHLGVHIDELR